MAGRVVIFGWSQSAHIQRWAPAMIERGYEIRLISFGGEPLEGVETFCLPRRNQWSYFTQAARAVKLAREFKPDLIHVHYAGGFGYWGQKCRFAPLLVSVWGADIVDLPRNPVQRWFIRRALRRADRVSATSKFLKRVTVDLEPAVSDRIGVIPFGVNLPEAVKPMPPAPVKLCFLKMHRKKYGPDILLRALEIARREVPDLHLTMAGDGPMRPELEHLTDQLGLAEQVQFVGLIPNNQIYSLLENHHIMVMPSVMDSESFGVAVLEASACGRPVIASRVGGVPEVVVENETGLLVPTGDIEALAEAIIELAGDLPRCEAMGQAGRKMVQATFEWSRSVDMMTSLYEEIINAR